MNGLPLIVEFRKDLYLVRCYSISSSTIFFYFDISSEIANYADDNHLYYENKCMDTVKCVLENDTNSAVLWFEENYMDANADKFQSIVLSRDVQPSLSISVQGNEITSENSIKVLGVTLDDRLKFDGHVVDICKRASRQINALKRISRYLNEDSRILVYNTFVSSTFSYCPVSWIFCGKKNSRKLDKLQERALRFVYRDSCSSYDDLLKRGGFLSLSRHRVRHLAIEVFRCVKGLNPQYLNDLFSERSVEYQLRDSCRLVQPKFNTVTYCYRSFRYFGAKLWNSLPRNVKDTDSLSIFKYNITRWLLSEECRDVDIS